ncbi:ABC-2 type transport system permease protein/lipopolysaccharide transport system permease protein [Kitasatospora gansuensis]|uniref:Transport permease protein n=1 Tax=Kitasatospora gansuensis TaxID=258050 RepID=A0A7W7SIY1_9ACTN|nr:ABC transporter permease [Kitasatospora gansuensis]MBB4950738.1 ABC-2 type transport system permease protein/lipopolysaccharide transport system permease protein [Kitasatospora gansuensis]
MGGQRAQVLDQRDNQTEARRAGADGPPAELIFKRRLRPAQVARELLGARELVRALAERDLRARYKQAVLGFAWAVLTPLALCAIFTLVFQRAVKIDTGGVAYPLFAYVGLIVWQFFSNTMNQGALSLANNLSLLNKVYCPREVFPLATMLVASVDMLIGIGVLGLLFLAFWTPPAITFFWVFPLLLIQLAFTYGVALVLSVAVVYLRDVRHLLPIITQMGVFATPVAYPLSQIPQGLQEIYVGFNPLGAVIEGYRRALLYGQAPDLALTGIAAASSVVFLVGGYLVFKKLETGIADVA